MNCNCLSLTSSDWFAIISLSLRVLPVLGLENNADADPIGWSFQCLPCHFHRQRCTRFPLYVFLILSEFSLHLVLCLQNIIQGISRSFALLGHSMVLIECARKIRP